MRGAASICKRIFRELRSQGCSLVELTGQPLVSQLRRICLADAVTQNDFRQTRERAAV